MTAHFTPPAPPRGTLYCIPTPIATDHELHHDLPQGTLARAAALDYFIAENAKSARAFLKRLPLTRPIQAIEIVELTERTSAATLDAWLTPLRTGRNAGLVSEAGCPAVADPGARLVEAAHQAGIAVMPMIGPSALLLTLMGSGLNGQCFSFVGYVPTEALAREHRITELERRSKQQHETILMIETPYRNMPLCNALLNVLSPQTQLCIAANLSGANQSLCTQTVAQWRQNTPKLAKEPTVFAFLA